MKPKTYTLQLSFLILILTLLAVRAFSQSNSPPASAGSVLSDAYGWVSSLNTNLASTFGAEHGSIWTGVDSVQGGSIPLENSVGAEYDVWRLAPTNGSILSLENVLRTGGVSGGLCSEQAGVGISYVLVDVKFTVYGHGGYLLTQAPDRVYGEIGLRIQKALGAHTGAWVGLGAQVPANRQVLSAGVLITF